MTTSPDTIAPITISPPRMRPTRIPVLFGLPGAMDFLLSKECEPERECKQRGQARIGQYWNREYDMSAQEQPARRDRECQARRQANQPCRKEGTQNVKGRGSTTTRANRTRKQQS